MTRARTLADLGSASLATDAELASEVSTINSAIAAKPTYAFSATAPSSPSNGDLWMDTSGASPKGKVWNGSEWKAFSGASVAAFDEGASTGATFTTLTNPDGDGKNYRLAEFTVGSGSLVIAGAGYAQTLMVAGGGGGNRGGGNGSSGGGAGGVLETLVFLDATTHAISVGAGGTGAFTAAAGSPTTFAGYTIRPGLGGSTNAGGGGGGGHSGNGYWSNGGGGGSAGNGGVGYTGGCCSPGGVGVVSSITGTAIQYGIGGRGNDKAGSGTTPGCGGGGGYDSWGDAPGGNGKNGIVYVRVEI